MSTSGPVAMLDANVLYAASVRDLLLTLASAALLVSRWTDEIHNEWITNLLRSRPDITPATLARTRSMMDGAFPEARVRGYERHVPSLHLPDAGDLHVLAAAIETGADLIVTFNLRDFPADVLRRHGLLAVDPDTLVSEFLVQNPGRVCDAIARRRERLTNPPMTADEFRASLARNNLPKTSFRLRDFEI